MAMLLKKFHLSAIILILSALFNLVPAQTTAPAFSLEEIFLQSKFAAKDIRGLSYINENEYLTQENFETEQYSVVRKWQRKDQTYTDIFDSRVLKNFPNMQNCLIDSYIQVDDDTWIVGQNNESIYRYSEKAYYYVVKYASKQVVALFPGKKQMYPQLSPDGKQVAFVCENNIYIRNLAKNKLTQVTADGNAGKIINGATDWVYEEEFGQTSAFEWSPDGAYIAYLKFDESRVKEIDVDFFRGAYPETYRFKYPRAGEENSKVSVNIYQLKNKKHIPLNVTDEYIPQIQWRPDGVLAFMHLPRLQNRLTVEGFDPINKKYTILYEESDEHYVELPICFTFLHTNTLAITSEKDGYNHLYFVDVNGNISQITRGNFDITTIYPIHEEEKLVYLQGFFNGPENLNIAVYHWDSNELNILSSANGNASADFVSPHCYIERYSADTVRRQIAIVNARNHEKLLLLDDRRTEDSILQKKHYITLPGPVDSLHAWVIFPPNFDSSQTYPVIFNVYGGPGAQEVVNTWHKSSELWMQYMAQNGYIIVSVDNRGTPGRGEQFKKCTYLQLGKLEIEDQFFALKYISTQWKFVHPQRIGIFGWSYGGYMSLLAMMQGEKNFKAAVSIAPVTHWKFYDSVYTERFMRTPAENTRNYERTSPLALAPKLQGELLLIHGMADDNVHFQNTVELIKALNDAGKTYRFLAYPNKNHGISGKNTQYHLFKSVTDFFLEKL